MIISLVGFAHETVPVTAVPTTTPPCSARPSIARSNANAGVALAAKAIRMYFTTAIPVCRRVCAEAWGVAFSLAIGMGYGLHLGLAETQRWLETAVPEWISGDGSRTDPYRATTDIGHIGKLKDSDAIVLRVFPAAEIGRAHV